MLRFKMILALTLALALMAAPAALSEADPAAAPLEAAVEETVVELGGSGAVEYASNAVEPSPNAGEWSLTRSSVQLGVGETFQLLPTDWSEASYPTFKMSKAKIVTVSATGEVLAKKKGAVTVTATLNGQSATCDIQVLKAPKTFKLDVTDVLLGYDAATGQGDRVTLMPTLTKNSASLLTYADYDPAVLSVEGETLIAVGTGTTRVTAMTFNKLKATVSVTVLPAPTTAKFEPEDLTVCAGEKCALKVVFNEGSASAMRYEVSGGCVQVDQNGVLTALNQGTATVRATAINGVTAECAVTVKAAPTKLFVEPAALTLGVGETSDPLKVTTDVEDAEGSYTFTTSKKSVVTVNDEGEVTAKKKGSANIKVTSAGGLNKQVKVTVKAAPKGVTVTPKSLELGTGDTAQLKAELTKNSWSNVRFTSSDPTVVEVDDTGLVTALRGGTAVITAATHNGKTDTCVVTVSGAASEIVLDSFIDLTAGQPVALPVTVTGEDGVPYAGTIKVTFNPEGYARYVNGKLTGLKAGETVMTVMAGGLSSSCTVRVTGTAHTIKSIAHRGGCGYWPENTLEAFRNAASKGADGIELDARSTKDGYQVIHHDASFKVGSKKYTVNKIKLSELQKLKPSVPTLDEALEVIDSTGLDIHLELKDTADGAKCVKAVKSHGLEDRTVYFSFYETQLKQVHKADPSATLGLSVNASEKYNGDALLKKIEDLHISFLVANKDMMNQTVTDYWHDMGLLISVWTPNKRNEVKALCELGVDFILSDYPDFCLDYR